MEYTSNISVKRTEWFQAKRLLSLTVLMLIIGTAASVTTQAQFRPNEKVEIGAVTHIGPTETGIRPQVWSIDRWAERLVATHEKGISIRIGSEWRLVETPGHTTVRSTAVGKDNLLYYGEQGSIGFVKVDSSGAYAAYSIPLPPDVIELGNVWATHAISDGILFQSRNYLLHWDGEQITTFHSNLGFHNSFNYDGTVIIREFNTGLYVYEQDRIKFIEGSEPLASEMVFGVTGNSNGLDIWSQNGKIYEYQNKQISSSRTFGEDLRAVADKFRLYTMVTIEAGRYIVGTLGSGAYLIDDKGRIQNQISIRQGFPDDFVNDIHIGKDGVIWFALNSEGVGGLVLDPVKLRFGKSHGLWGHINRIGEINGQIAVATGSRLMVMSMPDEHATIYSTNPNRSYFDEVPGTELAWDFHTSMGYTVVGTENEGVMIGPDGTTSRCTTAKTDVERSTGSLRTQVFSIYKDAYRKRLYAGTNDGLYEIKIHAEGNDNDSCLLYPLKIQGLDGVEVKSFAATPSRLWISTDNRGVFSVVFDGKRRIIEQHDISRLNIPGIGSYLHLVDAGQPYFASSTGVYELVDESEFRLRLINGTHSKEGNLQTIGTGHDSELLVAYRDSISIYIPSEGRQGYLFTPRELVGSKNITTSIFATENGVIFYNDGDELVRYIPPSSPLDRVNYSVDIVSFDVRDTGVRIFDGVFSSMDGSVSRLQPTSGLPSISYENREVLAFASSTSDIAFGPVYFQYGIDSPDMMWTSWSRSPEYSIANLKEGRYTLLARAKDDLGRISEPASFSFIILPPWYRTWWAYVAYVLMGSVLAFTGRKYMNMRRDHRLAREQAKELERERVVNRALQEANDELQKVNKLKDEFLATTSHELRTPLTAILGFTSVLKEEVPKDAEYREFLDIIQESGGRLMDTLNSLLDLAQLRSGNLELNIETVDVQALCQNVAGDLRDAAERKGLRFVVEESSESVRAQADAHAFERVLHNLTSNAIKFTEEGEVRIRVGRDGDSVRIDVIDTGVGIDKEFLPVLFQEYMQESDGLSRTHEGSGLGLAISSKMMELMNGTISVESAKNMGSTFSVWFPSSDRPAPKAAREDRQSMRRERPTSTRSSTV